MIKPTSKYEFTFAKDVDGKELKSRFMLTLSKPIKSVEAPFQQLLGRLTGLDAYGVVGNYTAEIVIARTFDAEEVIAELTKGLDDVLSDIIKPTLVTP